MSALRKLIEAVEAGTWDGSCSYLIHGCNIKAALEFSQAYHGSLDAAKALHEALLPGWGWYASDIGEVQVYPSVDGPFIEGQANTPARAWLIAILKAYEAQQ